VARFHTTGIPMTTGTFRKLALSLPGAEESAHMDHPDFRVGGRIFATMGYPRAGWAAVALTPADQAAFIAMDPEAFVPVKGKWGEQGATNIILRQASLRVVREALEAAHDIRVRKTEAGRRARSTRSGRRAR
jgi:hypothetical protein